ncbi:hypothetical protein L6452_22404 [Arctium lappa]|uniref:Uncharacterized protein n=1 Tax=Arctium lappa TaxID=4217 RepID=A0ACB9B006_ARCLA|nr:hypothetical protein L6452_22404 [Arctium lappa]
MTPSNDDDMCLINFRSSRDHYLEELQSALRSCDESSDEDLRDLIARVLEHYQQYYARRNLESQIMTCFLFSLRRGFGLLNGHFSALMDLSLD